MNASITLRDLVWRSRRRSAAVSFAVVAGVAAQWLRAPHTLDPRSPDAYAAIALAVSCALLPWLVGAHWRDRLRRSAATPPVPVYVDVLRSGLSAEPRWLAVRLEPDGEPVGWLALRGDQDVGTLQPGLVFVHGRVRRGEALVVSRVNGSALWPAAPLRGRTWALVRGLRPAGAVTGPELQGA